MENIGNWKAYSYFLCFAIFFSICDVPRYIIQAERVHFAYLLLECVWMCVGLWRGWYAYTLEHSYYIPGYRYIYVSFLVEDKVSPTYITPPQPPSPRCRLLYVYFIFFFSISTSGLKRRILESNKKKNNTDPYSLGNLHLHIQKLNPRLAIPIEKSDSHISWEKSRDFFF